MFSPRSDAHDLFYRIKFKLATFCNQVVDIFML